MRPPARPPALPPALPPARVEVDPLNSLYRLQFETHSGVVFTLSFRNI